MRKKIRLLFGAVAPSVAFVLAAALYWQVQLPDSFQMTAGGSLRLPSLVTAVFQEEDLSQQGNPAGVQVNAELKLPFGVSVKTVDVEVIDRKIVTVSGKPFGIKMFTNGLMVVGMSDFSAEGKRINPGKAAGVQVGDILISLNGITLVSNEQLGALVQGSDGKKMQLVYQHDGREQSVWVTPMQSTSDGRYHLGIWVRDSSAGVGTITYFDEENGTFAGLGHPICDIDTGDILSLSSGEAVEAVITGYNAGRSGDPGELKGKFIGNKEFGILTANCECGVYGRLHRDYACTGRQMPIALAHEVETGPAAILTTIDGSDPREYDVTVEKVLRGKSGGQNMVICITDEELLGKTGGIIQGMSGSPIIQDGKLIGAVTHVFVEDPARGYGIFIENMLDAAG